jgi:hypothetical protein
MNKKYFLSILFILATLCLFLPAPFFITQIKIFILKRNILLQNSDVVSVEVLSSESYFYLEEGRFLIKFNDGGWMLLKNISFVQDKIIFESCNGYSFLIYSRSLNESNENKKYLYSRYSGIEPQPYSSYFGHVFYEKLLNVSLKNIDEFINAYRYFSEYLNKTGDISSKKYNDKILYSNWVWDPDENLKKIILDWNGELFEYVIFKKRTG